MPQIEVFVIHPMGRIFNIPCVPNIADMIGREGTLRVHFIALRDSNSPEGEFGPGIAEVHWSPVSLYKSKVSFWSLLVYLFYAFQLIRRSGPAVILAAGFRGLILGYVLSVLTGKPLCSYNLEFHVAVGGLLRRMASFLERRCLPRVQLLIIHDESRGVLYQKLMNRRFDRVAYFPNSPLRSEVNAEDRRAISGKMGFVSNRKYILYSGGLYENFPIEALISTLNRLDDCWGFILQSHDGYIGFKKDPRFFDEVTAGRIILNDKPLSVKDYNAMLSLCRIGMADYKATDDNMKFVGLSSGKIGYYWLSGIPVLVNNIPFYNTVCAQYRSGEVFSNLAEIPELVRRIDKDYETYRSGAFRCFAEFFNESHYVPRLVEELTRLAHT